MEKPRKPKQDRGIETKNRLLAAGLELFSRKGLHGTSSREIVAAAGLSIGSFYGYFKDKRALFIELLKKHRINVMQILQGARPSETQVENEFQFIRLLIQAIWQSHDAIRDFEKHADTLRDNDAEINKILATQESEVLKQIVSMLNANADRLRKKDTDLSAKVVLLIIKEFMHTTPASMSRRDLNQLFDELADMISRYLFDT